MGEAGRAEASGFTVLDGAALVAGAAVSAAHIRGAIRGEPAGAGWVVLLGTFVWVSLTAAGPFLYLFRRYLRPIHGYPRVGDRLWAILGLPWLFTSLLPVPPAAAGDVTRPASELLTVLLAGGIAVASVVAVSVVWVRWVMVPPEQAARTFSGPWTNYVGLVLAIAWPIQCGVGMVVIG